MDSLLFDLESLNKCNNILKQEFRRWKNMREGGSVLILCSWLGVHCVLDGVVRVGAGSMPADGVLKPQRCVQNDKKPIKSVFFEAQSVFRMNFQMDVFELTPCLC